MLLIPGLFCVIGFSTNVSLLSVLLVGGGLLRTKEMTAGIICTMCDHRIAEFGVKYTSDADNVVADGPYSYLCLSTPVICYIICTCM